MEREELKGRGKQVQGKAREFAGRVTGERDQEVKGRGEQYEGKAREKAGGAMGWMKDMARKLRGD